MLKQILLLCLPALLCPQLNAEYTWNSVSIGGGGYVTSMEFHPTEKNQLYLRTDVGGAYRWHNDTSHWQALNDSTTRTHADDWGVLSIALDPDNADTLYLLTGLYIQNWAANGALLISHNRGNTWQRITLPFKVGGNESGRGAGERLIVNPNNPQHLIAGTQNQGLWQSSDQGISWKKIENFPETGVTFIKIISDKKTKSPIIYVASQNKNHPLYASHDVAIRETKKRSPWPLLRTRRAPTVAPRLHTEPIRSEPRPGYRQRPSRSR